MFDCTVIPEWFCWESMLNMNHRHSRYKHSGMTVVQALSTSALIVVYTENILISYCQSTIPLRPIVVYTLKIMFVMVEQY